MIETSLYGSSSGGGAPTGVVLVRRIALLRGRRSAILPYSIDKEGELRFLFGIDRESGDITDIGGGIKKYETYLSAATREFSEETNGVFGKLSVHDLSMCYALHDEEKQMVSILTHLNVQNHLPIEVYNKEIKGLIWLSCNEFLELESQVYSRVRRFYKPFMEEDSLKFLGCI